jgi:uncharacterized membrane protein
MAGGGDVAMPAGVAGVVEQMQQRLDALPAGDARTHFLGTYQRTTAAVGRAIEHGVFEDPDWVEEWDVRFAELYLEAYDAVLDGRRVARPWRLAFDAPAELPALRHVLLGINAHINYDLPQALLRVIGVAEFADPVLMARRRRDHERIDGVLSSRVAAEDDGLPAGSLVDRVLTPVNRLATRRFLAEARRKVWHNTDELQAARVAGAEAYRTRLSELEVLSAARIADLTAPGQVLLRLAVAGFGVTLPPPAEREPSPVSGQRAQSGGGVRDTGGEAGRVVG